MLTTVPMMLTGKAGRVMIVMHSLHRAGGACLLVMALAQPAQGGVSRGSAVCRFGVVAQQPRPSCRSGCIVLTRT